MGENDELIKEFLVESYDNLDRLDREFLALEKDPTNKDYLSSIFRTIHTIKGTSGFFGFEHLQALTHVGENLLSKLRDGKLTLNGDMANALLAMVDAVRGMLGIIESTGVEGQTDHSALKATLSSLQEDQPVEATADHGGGHQPGPLTAMFEAANAKPPVKPPEKTAAAPPAAVAAPTPLTPKLPVKSPKIEELAKGSEAHGPSLTARVSKTTLCVASSRIWIFTSRMK